jgi:hypothetical protein
MAVATPLAVEQIAKRVAPKVSDIATGQASSPTWPSLRDAGGKLSSIGGRRQAAKVLPYRS